jgi:hypothetical protein
VVGNDFFLSEFKDEFWIMSGTSLAGTGKKPWNGSAYRAMFTRQAQELHGRHGRWHGRHGSLTELPMTMFLPHGLGSCVTVEGAGVDW